MALYHIVGKLQRQFASDIAFLYSVFIPFYFASMSLAAHLFREAPQQDAS